MNLITIILSIIGMIGILSSIFFTFLAYRRINHLDLLSIVKKEGKMIVDNVRKTIAKIGGSIKNITKRVDEIYKSEGG